MPSSALLEQATSEWQATPFIENLEQVVRTVEVSMVTFKNSISLIEKNLREILNGSHEGISIAVNIFDNGVDRDLQLFCDRNNYNYHTVGRNIGFGAGHNYIYKIRQSTGKCFLLINPDVEFNGCNLKIIVDFLFSDNSIGIVSPRLLNDDGSLQKTCRYLPSPISLFLRKVTGGLFFSDEVCFADQTSIFSVPFIHGACFFIRSDVIEKIGLFDERYFLYCEDMDLCRRALSFYKVINFGTVAAKHSHARGSSKSLKLFVLHTRSALAYFKKWGFFVDKERAALNKTQRIYLY